MTMGKVPLGDPLLDIIFMGICVPQRFVEDVPCFSSEPRNLFLLPCEDSKTMTVRVHFEAEAGGFLAWTR